MLVWIVYDIVEDKIRNKAAKICKNKGLYRVQKSVFLGTLEDNEIDELRLQMEDLINLEQDSVYVFPSTKEFFKKTLLIGQAFDRRLVTDEIVSKFV